MVAFDEVPVLNGDSTPFEKRYESILSNISWDNPFVVSFFNPNINHLLFSST